MAKMNSSRSQYHHVLVLVCFACLWCDARGFVSPFPTPSTAFRVCSGASFHSGTSTFADVSGTQDDVVESTGPVDSPESSVDAPETAVDATEDEVDAPESASQEEPSEEETKSIKRERHTLFVGNIPFETQSSELIELFSQHGNVKQVSIPIKKEDGRARGFAFVDMGSAEELQQCIDNLNGHEYAGRTIRVSRSLPRDEARKQAKKTDSGVQKVYVGNLPFDVTREDVVELFSKYGRIRDCYLPMNQETGSPRGFAFVTLDEDVAEKAIEETNGQDFLGRTLSVSLPLAPGEKAPRRGREPRQKLYVGNLSFYTQTDTLAELFSEFGEVHDCYLPQDNETGETRGFGFVTLDKEAAEAAIDATDGIELDGRIIRVNAAQPKGSRNTRDREQNENNDWPEDESDN